MGLRSKQSASPKVLSSLVFCAVLVVSVLIVPGATSAIEPAPEAAGETVEVALWSPSTWMAWLVGWLTGDVQVTQEAASADSCIAPDCTPPDSETTGSDGTGDGDRSLPEGEGTPGLDVNG